MQNFRMLGAPPPDPQNSPPLRISGNAPAYNIKKKQQLLNFEQQLSYTL